MTVFFFKIRNTVSNSSTYLLIHGELGRKRKEKRRGGKIPKIKNINDKPKGSSERDIFGSFAN